jgi:hypothetical protein
MMQSSVSRPHYPAGDNGCLQKMDRPSRVGCLPISTTKSARNRHADAVATFPLLRDQRRGREAAQSLKKTPTKHGFSASSQGVLDVAPVDRDALAAAVEVNAA